MRTFLFLLAWLFAATFCSAQRGPLPGFSTDTPYLIYYGNWTDAQAGFARDHYHMVILHPSVSNVTPAQIATIQSGPDRTVDTKDDVPVLAYISVGEDDRPGAPAAGNGTGPRVDPRNSHSDPLAGIPTLGDPSPGGTGFASYYLDDGVLSDPNSTGEYRGGRRPAQVDHGCHVHGPQQPVEVVTQRGPQRTQEVGGVRLGRQTHA